MKLTPGEGAAHVALIVLQLQVLALLVATCGCGPLYGIGLMVGSVIVLPYVVLPVELLATGIPGLIAFLVLRRRSELFGSRAWWTLQYGLAGLLVATLVLATVLVATGHGSTDCEFV